MPSGIMAQNIALLIHSKKEFLIQNDNDDDDDTRRRRRDNCNDMCFACHHSSHLLIWEEESYSKLVGFRAIKIDTAKSSSCQDDIDIPPMKLEGVQDTFSLEKKKKEEEITMTLGESGLSSLILELPHRELGGKLTPWDDVISIGELCMKENVKYHCDGARIFEASAGYG